MLTITHTIGDGTLVAGTERGDGSAAVLKAHRFRWSRNLGSWYVPRSRDRIADRQRIEATAAALRAAGFDVAVEIGNAAADPAEREAQRGERAQARHAGLSAKAERLAGEAAAAQDAARAATAGIPFGQPILVGHHSERRHRAALARSDRAMSRAIEAGAESAAADRSARVALREQDRRRTPAFIGNRIRALEAEQRDIDRKLAGTSANGVALGQAAAGAWREDLQARLDQVRADLGWWREQLAAVEQAGGRLWSRADFKRGDRVRVHGHLATVERANAKTLTVRCDVMPVVTQRYPYTDVQERLGDD